MAYQNNNNRITPKAQGKTQITPVTQVVNKELKYQPDLRDSQATQNLAQSLAAIGKGIIDFEQSGILQKKAQEQAIELAQGQIQENQLAWKDAQKQVKGLNIFNPYNKPAYENLVVKDFYNKAKTELMSDPDFYKRKPEEIQKFIQSKEQAFKELINQNEIPINVSGKYLEAFRQDCLTFNSNYVLKNKEYTTGLLHNKLTANMSTDIRKHWINAPKEEQGLIFGEILKKYQEENPTLTEEDLLNDFFNASKTAIMSHDGVLEFDIIKDGIKNLELNGKKLSELVPDIDIKLNDTCKSAEQDRYRQLEWEYTVQQKQTQKRVKEAEKALFTEMINNPDVDLVSLAKQVAEQYDVVGEYNSLLTSIVGAEEKIDKLENSKSDEEVLKYFDTKLGLDILDTKELTEGYLQGKISRSDYYHILDRYVKKEKQTTDAITKQQTQAYKAQLSEAKNYATTEKENLKNIKSIDGKGTAYSEYLQAVAHINTLVESDIYTPEEGKQALAELPEVLKKRYQTKFTVTDELAKNVLSKKWREKHLTDLDASQYDKEAAERCLSAFGIISSPFGLKITSGIEKNRTVTLSDGTTKTSNHNHYDVRATVGTPLRLPAECEGGGYIVASGKEDTMGYYALVRLNESNSFMLVQHLSGMPIFKAGENIPAGYVFAYTGDTGQGSAPHLDIGFYSADMKRQTIGQALKGIDRKKANDIERDLKKKKR